MAAFNPKSKNHYRVRSVSLPTRSHPSTIRIEQAVNKLKTWETSSSSFSKADKICLSLSGLKELHEGIEELLALPLTQQALSQHQQDHMVNELVEESVRYVDVCSNARDTVMQMKEGIKGLQSSLRRSKLRELRTETDVASFMCSRKILQKEISRSLAKLKHVDNKMVPLHLSNSEDDQLSIVLRALTEASLLNISTFSSLLLFLSVPVMKLKPTRWTLVSNFIYKGVLACEGERNNLNELEDVDIALGNLLIDDSGKDDGTERIESAQKKLEALETILESLENGLELLFRHLIRTRVSLLNILSAGTS
ncbi:uncharacterized protein [Coffea arabica]|uniref:DUF241 domain protein n=1 Tax=Coffea arabica TaxID=13443 RepID=A0A6P6T963_COFAR